MLARVWRFMRIAHGLIMSMHELTAHQLEEHAHQAEDSLKFLEEEAAALLEYAKEMERKAYPAARQAAEAKPPSQPPSPRWSAQNGVGPPSSPGRARDAAVPPWPGSPKATVTVVFTEEGTLGLKFTPNKQTGQIELLQVNPGTQVPRPPHSPPSPPHRHPPSPPPPPRLLARRSGTRSCGPGSS